jgi:peptidyl-prolyl cis-trans isomerase C
MIAKIGNEKLTLEDLKKSIPAEYRDQISKEQNVNYVKQWMDAELLYQEAVRRKIDKEPEIKSRLKKMQKDLLAAEVISRISLENKDNGVSAFEITEYYNKHQKDFIRDTDKIKYLEIITEDQKSAWYINRTLTNQNYEELASQYSKISSTEPLNTSYVPVNEIPEEIKTVINSYSPEVNTLPIKTNLGYHVVRVLDRLKKGDFCTEDEVRDDIVNILSNKAQKQRIEKLLSDLRLKTDVQFNLDILKDIPSETTQQK